MLTFGVSYLWDRDIVTGWTTTHPAPLVPCRLPPAHRDVETPASKHFEWDLTVVCAVYQWVEC